VEGAVFPIPHHIPVGLPAGEDCVSGSKAQQVWGVAGVQVELEEKNNQILVNTFLEAGRG
jgi:hypothetical protein